jgi:lysophospholipase L1-like esterase
MRSRAVVIVAATVLVAGVLVAGRIVVGSHAERTLRWVALGDSYTSGEGNDPMDATAPCTRSAADAYPIYASNQLRASGVDVALDFEACSAAVVADLPRQAANVTAATDLVTMTIGGNDAGFGAIVAGCLRTGVLRLLPGLTPCGVDDRDLAQKMAAVRQRVTEGLTAIRGRLDHHATVLLLGYPDPLPTGGTCGLFGTNETARAAQLATALDATLADAADAVRGVEYVSMLGPFAGHDTCADQPWIRGLQPKWNDAIHLSFKGSFHPSTAGAQAYADVLLSRLRLSG